VPTVDEIDALLPQTQCTRCGYPDCRRYAEAIAVGEAGINQCPPGGVEGIERLAALTGRPALPLDPAHGQEGPVRIAVIDEAWCIGCTLCIQACPVDCIVGAARQMHTVIEAQCTGCELCVPACPVDCIALEDSTPGRSGWAAWSPQQAQDARARHLARGERLQRRAAGQTAQTAQMATPAAAAGTGPGDKRQVIEAILARARAAAAHRKPT
jgi:Na+-translocating ferredoxin:NAD+ oxidoreductase subunit B